MNERLVAHLVSIVFMAGCCIGLPLLIGFLGGLGLFAWFADNGLALSTLALIVVAGYLLHRDRRKRRQARARREAAIGHRSADEVQPSTPQGHHRSPGKRSY